MSATVHAGRLRGWALAGAGVRPGHALATTGSATPARRGGGARIGLAIALSLALCASRAGAAGPDGKGRWFLEAAAGVSNMQLGDMKNVYGQVLDYYRSNGVPVETQREFPANLIAGGDVLYGFGSRFRLGLGARYTWSHAYSLYGDYAGTLDVVGEVRLFAVESVARMEWPGGGAWSPFAELRLGRGYVSIEMTETVVLTNPPAGAAEAVLSGEGEAPLAEFHLGVTRSRGGFRWIGSAGYRFGKVPGPPFDVDVSGFVTTLGAGWSF